MKIMQKSTFSIYTVLEEHSLLICLFTVYSSCGSDVAERTSWDTDVMTHKSENIYCLSLYGKTSLILV